MTNLQVTLQAEAFKNRQHLHLNKSNSDIFIVLNNKIYPAHRNCIHESKLIIRELQKIQTSIYIIQKQLQNDLFEKILAFVYGFGVSVHRNQKMTRILQIATYLQIQSLASLILNDMRVNSQQYQIFMLFTVSQKYKLQWLKKICLQELIAMDFQQMNYNRYEFIQCDKPIFQQIIALFMQYQKQKIIKGITIDQLKLIIQQYNNYHSLQTNINLIMQNLIFLVTIKQQEFSDLQKSQSNVDNIMFSKDEKCLINCFPICTTNMSRSKDNWSKSATMCLKKSKQTSTQAQQKFHEWYLSQKQEMITSPSAQLNQSSLSFTSITQLKQEKFQTSSVCGSDKNANRSIKNNLYLSGFVPKQKNTSPNSTSWSQLSTNF